MHFWFKGVVGGLSEKFGPLHEIVKSGGMSDERSPIVGYILHQIQNLSSAEIISILYECAAELCMRSDVRRQQRQDAVGRSAREDRHRNQQSVGGVPSESDSEDSL